ncbi:MAG: hypothetical protein AAFR66_15410 [Bacteroidota bacterium]
MKSTPTVMLALLAIVITYSCSAPQETAEETPEEVVEEVTADVIEIAVRAVKEGQKIAFEEARAGFIGKWLSSEGVEVDREYKAFYNIPQSEQEVFVGMTSWTSLDNFNTASQSNGQSPEAMAFFQTFDMLAFVQAKATEGDFDLASIGKTEGSIIEIAVRKVSPETAADFNEKRLPYIAALNEVEGVLGSYEFEVLGGYGENLTVGMTEYKDQTAFQAVNETVNQSETAKAYFSAFEIVTIQYVNSVK